MSYDFQHPKMGLFQHSYAKLKFVYDIGSRMLPHQRFQTLIVLKTNLNIRSNSLSYEC